MSESDSPPSFMGVEGRVRADKLFSCSSTTSTNDNSTSGLVGARHRPSARSTPKVLFSDASPDRIPGEYRLSTLHKVKKKIPKEEASFCFSLPNA